VVALPGLGIEAGDIAEYPVVRETFPEVVAVFAEEMRWSRELLHEAAQATAGAWLTVFETPMADTVVIDLSRVRRLMTAVTAAAKLDCKDGRQTEFLDAVSDILAATDQLDRYSAFTSIEHFVWAHLRTSAAQALVHHALDLQIADCAASEAAARELPERDEVVRLIALLLDEEANWHGAHTALCGERATQLDSVHHRLAEGGKALLNGTGWPQEFALMMARPAVYSEAITMVHEFSRVIQYIRDREPITSVTPLLAGRKNSGISAGLPPELRFGDLLMPSLQRFMLVHYNSIAHTRMAAIALSIRLFELDHGRLPHGLAELAPDYLTALPVDPFSPHDEPICWSTTATAILLYHRGENGVDDRGSFRLWRHGGFDLRGPDVPAYLRCDPRERSWRMPRELRVTESAEPVGSIGVERR
jgi:hypothetical protein